MLLALVASMLSVVLGLAVAIPSESGARREMLLEQLEPKVRAGRVRGRSKRLALVEVGDGARLEIEAGVFFLWMKRVARSEGIEVRIESAFRTFEEQARLYTCFVECSCNRCRRAAKPGYSAHEAGNAVDLDVSAVGAREWLEVNAKRFGFEARVAEEPWHFEFVGVVERSTSTERAPAGAR